MVATQSLPSEIIREIFKYFSTSLLVRNNGQAAHFPWYLGHICSPWRAVFLSMKREFWSNFLLCPISNYYWKHRTSQAQCAAIAEAFLEHNRGLPISFHIHRYLWRTTRPILDMFMKESSRWQDVSFTVEFSDIPSLTEIKNRLPNLRSLNLDTTTGHSGEIEPTPIPRRCQDIFKDAPHLVHLKLPDLSTWQFTWSSLLSLELTKWVSDPELLSVLPEMVNLEKLVVREVDVGVGNTPFTLPSLKVLVMFRLSLLRILTSPVLEQLSLDVEDDLDRISMPFILSSFIHRSSCQLQIFGVSGCPISDLAHALWHMPKLKFLGFLSYMSLEEIFELLTYSPNKPPLVAELLSLRVLPYGVFHRPALTALISFLDSRTINRPASIHRMQQVAMVMREIPDDMYHMLEEVREQCSIRDIQLRFETSTLGDRDWDTHRICGFDDDLFQYFSSAPVH